MNLLAKCSFFDSGIVVLHSKTTTLEMSYITLDNFEDHAVSEVQLIGQKLYERGYIKAIEDLGEGHYEVYILLKGVTFYVDMVWEGDHLANWKCNCNWKPGMCTHIVAACYELREERDKLKSKKKKEKKIPREQLHDLYYKLEPTAQRLVKIIALNWEGLGQTNLLKKFNKSGLKHKGRTLSSTEIKPMLAGLVETSILYRQNDNRYICLPDFSDYLCNRYFSADPDFSEIATHLFGGAEAGYDCLELWYVHK